MADGRLGGCTACDTSRGSLADVCADPLLAARHLRSGRHPSPCRQPACSVCWPCGSSPLSFPTTS